MYRYNIKNSIMSVNKTLKIGLIATVLFSLLGIESFASSQYVSDNNNNKIKLTDRPSLSDDTKTAVKLNAAVFVGIVNPAVEFKALRNATVQLEALGVFANTSFLGTGKPLELGADKLFREIFREHLFMSR